jgi:inhibitor of KinA
MRLFEKPLIRYVGDRGVLVEYGGVIDPVVNQKVRAMAQAARAQPPAGIIEIIPTYRSLLILYDPLLTCPQDLLQGLTFLEKDLSGIVIPPPKTVEIPVCYGGDFGPDIDFVAQIHDLSVEDVVRFHAEPSYLIYMIGFTPGFPYLGGLPEILTTPRLETPRQHVPAGSVGIANAQTGIYPIDSPGGWQLIGRTPLQLFKPQSDHPFLYQAGDRLKFTPISEHDYHLLQQEQESAR